jgi:2-iminobutanoate/2-iminopropanoate deaminase
MFPLKSLNLQLEICLMREVFSIPGAPKPIGPYSQAVRVDKTLYVSGQIPLNPQTNELVVDNIENATHRVLQNIKALVEVSGMQMSDVVKVSIFIKDMGEFSKINAVYAQYFAGVFPARETVQVSELPMGVPIEISCIAIAQ